MRCLWQNGLQYGNFVRDLSEISTVLKVGDVSNMIGEIMPYVVRLPDILGRFPPVCQLRSSLDVADLMGKLYNVAIDSGDQLLKATRRKLISVLMELRNKLCIHSWCRIAMQFLLLLPLPDDDVVVDAVPQCRSVVQFVGLHHDDFENALLLLICRRRLSKAKTDVAPEDDILRAVTPYLKLLPSETTWIASVHNVFLLNPLSHLLVVCNAERSFIRALDNIKTLVSSDDQQRAVQTALSHALAPYACFWDGSDQEIVDCIAEHLLTGTFETFDAHFGFFLVSVSAIANILHRLKPDFLSETEFVLSDLIVNRLFESDCFTSVELLIRLVVGVRSKIGSALHIFASFLLLRQLMRLSPRGQFRQLEENKNFIAICSHFLSLNNAATARQFEPFLKRFLKMAHNGSWDPEITMFCPEMWVLKGIFTTLWLCYHPADVVVFEAAIPCIRDSVNTALTCLSFLAFRLERLNS
ncbi:unnamed protein product [Soboliphyme baturini]|uniref:DUF2428 domain-containing protein n=1 Tax=Soboliphyme baturini TaxID=241478 RepID=A0A183J3N2_9BILA|nr:unnamed protein product [Soboliphyme baturini]